MSDIHTGSCQCKNVYYEINGSFESFYLCHCSYCQKDSGSAHSANLFSTAAALKWITGQDKVKTFNIPSTRHVKSFCVECGSALPNLQMEGKLLVVPAGSLDSKISLKPNAHIFCASRANWDVDLETVKKFENFPS
ncbi:GFA family protein [Bdellovibrio svalbardensis]|uniref:GFA family protein n=1 Tax=Bdellovibrio svalbardensis TaxID=2972972 RepID=A0ABT6DHZ3_9BACT|nr:GFA family protein [Bdellovibrio svalbardensis]MDG0816476.1 GFA family protein [Bdellovibrio svalbardensis]